MKYKKLNKVFFYCIFGLMVILVIIGSFFDFEINDTIYMGRDNGFLKFIAAIGVGLPFSGFALFGGFLLADAREHKKLRLFKHLLFAIAIASVLVGEMISSDQFAGYNGYNLEESGKDWIAYLIWLPIEAGLFFLGFKQGKKNEIKNIWIVCIAMLLMMLLGNKCTVDILKAIMHRPRYRAIMDGSPLLNETFYHNWWEPFKEYKEYIELGINADEFKSFPSGHSCSAAIMIMMLSYLPFVFPSLKNKRTLLFFIGFGYAIFIMASRMLIGAHFLTDVSIGFLSFFIYFFIGNTLLEKKVLKDVVIDE